MKKISRRTFLNVMGAAGAAGALAACGGSSSGSSAAGASSAAMGGSSAAAGGDVTIRITWWGGQSRHEYTQQLLDKYTELNPSVHFQATPSGWDGYFEKLATDTADYCGETPAPDPTGISEINTYFKDIAYSVFYGQATPAEAAATFFEQANSVLAANN